MYRYRLFIKMTCDKSAFKQLEVSFVHFFLVTACHECFQCTSMNGRFIHIDDAHFDNFPRQFNIESRSNARKIEPEKAWKKSSLWAINPGFENLISLIAKKCWNTWRPNDLTIPVRYLFWVKNKLTTIHCEYTCSTSRSYPSISKHVFDFPLTTKSILHHTVLVWNYYSDIADYLVLFTGLTMLILSILPTKTWKVTHVNTITMFVACVFFYLLQGWYVYMYAYIYIFTCINIYIYIYDIIWQNNFEYRLV